MDKNHLLLVLAVSRVKHNTIKTKYCCLWQVRLILFLLEDILESGDVKRIVLIVLSENSDCSLFVATVIRHLGCCAPVMVQSELNLILPPTRRKVHKVVLWQGIADRLLLWLNIIQWFSRFHIIVALDGFLFLMIKPILWSSPEAINTSILCYKIVC